MKHLASQRALIGSLGAGASIQLLLIPTGVLVARMLGPEDRGYYAILVLIPSVLGLIGTLGLHFAIPYYLAQPNYAPAAILRTVTKPALFQLSGLLLLHTVTVIALFGNAPGPLRDAALISLFSLPGTISIHYGLAALQGMHQFAAFNALRVAPGLIYAVMVVTLFVFGIRDIRLVMIAVTSSAALVGFLAVVIARGAANRGGGPQRSPSIGQMLAFGGRTLLGSVSPIENLKLDQSVVAAVLSPAALGTYVVASAFTNFPRFIGQSVGLIAYPRVASKASGQEARHALVEFTVLTAFLAGATVLALIVVTPLVIVPLFGREFASASEVTTPLLLAAFVASVRRVLADSLKGAGFPLAGSIAETAAMLGLVGGVVATVSLHSLSAIAAAVLFGALVGLLVVVAAVLTVQWRQSFNRPLMPIGEPDVT